MKSHLCMKNLNQILNIVYEMLILAGVKSCWSLCALSLPLNPDLGWSMWLQGFSLSLWLRLEHGGSNAAPSLTRTASFSTVSDSSSVSDWGVISDAWATKENSEYEKCQNVAVAKCVLWNPSLNICYCTNVMQNHNSLDVLQRDHISVMPSKSILTSI